MMSGFEKRITRELLKHFDCKIKASDNRNHLAFVGATKLISHISTENSWISKKEYDETGSSIINRKCF